jgi:hypothetical protein
MLLGLQPSHLPEFRMRFSVANVPSRVPKNEPSSERGFHMRTAYRDAFQPNLYHTWKQMSRQTLVIRRGPLTGQALDWVG